MELFIIYIILSAFGIGGTKIFNKGPIWANIFLCITLGWILFPCMIMFVFGKIIDNVNDRY